MVRLVWRCVSARTVDLCSRTVVGVFGQVSAPGRWPVSRHTPTRPRPKGTAIVGWRGYSGARPRCPTTIVSARISYTTRYRPTRSRRRSGDPKAREVDGRGSSARASIASRSTLTPSESSARKSAARLIAFSSKVISKLTAPRPADDAPPGRRNRRFSPPLLEPSSPPPRQRPPHPQVPRQTLAALGHVVEGNPGVAPRLRSAHLGGSLRRTPCPHQSQWAEPSCKRSYGFTTSSGGSHRPNVDHICARFAQCITDPYGTTGQRDGGAVRSTRLRGRGWS